MNARQAARARRDYEAADRIREMLDAHGVELFEKEPKGGNTPHTWRTRDGRLSGKIPYKGDFPGDSYKGDFSGGAAECAPPAKSALQARHAKGGGGGGGGGGRRLSREQIQQHIDAREEARQRRDFAGTTFPLFPI